MESLPKSEDELGAVSLFGALVLTITAFAAMYGLTVALAFLYGHFHELSFRVASAHIQSDLLTLTLAQLCGMGGALFIGLRIFEPDASLRDAVAAYPTRSKTLGLSMLAGACLQFPLAELANVLHERVFGPDTLEEQLAVQQLLEATDLLEGALVVACIVAAVPTVEELFFRGFLFFGLARRYGAPFAVLSSAALFGIVHAGAVPAVYATTAGLALGCLALWTRSVWPGVAMHAAVNAVPVLLPERVWPLPGFNVPSLETYHLPAWLVFPPLLAGVAFLAWVRRIEYAHDQ